MCWLKVSNGSVVATIWSPCAHMPATYYFISESHIIYWIPVRIKKKFPFNLSGNPPLIFENFFNHFGTTAFTFQSSLSDSSVQYICIIAIMIAINCLKCCNTSTQFAFINTMLKQSGMINGVKYYINGVGYFPI